MLCLRGAQSLRVPNAARGRCVCLSANFAHEFTEPNVPKETQKRLSRKCTLAEAPFAKVHSRRSAFRESAFRESAFRESAFRESAFRESASMNSQLGAGFDPAVAPPRARARCAASAHQFQIILARVTAHERNQRNYVRIQRV